jgi:hypothetical protein
MLRLDTYFIKLKSIRVFVYEAWLQFGWQPTGGVLV